MFDALLGMLGSAAGGGLLGMIGSLGKGWLEARERENDRQHQLAMRKVDLLEMEKEAELQLRQTETELAGQARIVSIEGDTARDVAAAELQGESYEHDQARYSNGVLDKLTGRSGGVARFFLVLVDVVRGFMRPAITTYVLVLASLMTWQLHGMVEQLAYVKPEQAWPLYQSAVDMVLFLTVTAVVWWFGSRPSSKTQA